MIFPNTFPHHAGMLPWYELNLIFQEDYLNNGDAQV